MPRFFVENGNITEGRVVIQGDDFFHMSRTLRMKVGEAVTACDEQGMEYRCVIEAMDSQQATLAVLEQAPSGNEPTLEVCLYQCVPKGDKMDTIVQKAVELGVSRVVPVLSRNCVVKLDAKGGAKKAERWGKIAREAAKQCGRGRIPVVEQPIPFAQALEEMKRYERPVLFYEEERETGLGQLLKPELRQLAFLVGSEGGFTPQEAESARQAGIPTATLGRRILRTETVAAMVLSIAMYVTDNL